MTLLHQAKSEEEAVLCLSVLESVIAYSSLPSCTLNTVIIALTRTVSVPRLTITTFKVNLFNVINCSSWFNVKYLILRCGFFNDCVKYND